MRRLSHYLFKDWRHDTRPIHIVPDDAFDDWIVREDDGQELGHYPTREAAELVAEAIARKRGGKLVIDIPDGRRQCRSFAKSWLARLLAR